MSSIGFVGRVVQAIIAKKVLEYGYGVQTSEVVLFANFSRVESATLSLRHVVDISLQ